MQASSIDIMAGGVIPCMRSIARIVVLHMSAQFMHAGAQSISCIEHTVHACSQAEQASIHSCIMLMSIAAMPGIDASVMAPIIIASIRYPPSRFRDGQDHPPEVRLDLFRQPVESGHPG